MATKHVLVTGGNKGIGFAICKLLLESEPNIVVHLGSRDLVRGKEAVDVLRDADGKSDRISLVELDVTSDDSVKAAATQLHTAVPGGKLHGLVNNAGIGFNNSYRDTIETNYFGVRRVTDAFLPLLERPGGRIVTVASAAGPMFVDDCDCPELKKKLADPRSCTLEELDALARSYQTDDKSDTFRSYSMSKAFANAYTVICARDNPDLIINACTPGYVKTDIAPEGTTTPEQGASCPVHLLLSPEIAKLPTGRYYGSDKLRSPLDRYRGPGDAEYDGP